MTEADKIFWVGLTRVSPGTLARLLLIPKGETRYAVSANTSYIMLVRVDAGRGHSFL